MAKGYYGQNASAVGVPFAAPDLSNVMGMAEKAGQNAAYANFLEDLLKQRKEQAKAAKAAEKAAEKAATEEASNNDEESFLDKLGDGTLGALDWTLDKLSRGSYMVQNAKKYILEQDEETHDDGFLGAVKGFVPGANMLDSVDDLNFGDVGGALKAAWEGLSGEEKTTVAENRAINNAKNPNNKYLNWRDTVDSKPARYALGGAEFFLNFGEEVVGDPVSYVGAGLVTKPLKKVVENNLDNELAEDLAKTGLKRGDIADDAAKSELGPQDLDEVLTADDFRSIMGQISDNPGYAAPVGLTRRGRRAYNKAHELKGRQALISKSGQIARTKHRMDTMANISEALGKKIAHPEASSKIKSMLDEAQESYKKAVDESGSRAFKAALAKAEKAVPDATGAVKSVKYAKAVSFVTMTNMVKNASIRDRLQNQLDTLEKKPSKSPLDLKEIEKRKKDIQALNDELIKDGQSWTNHPDLSPELLREAFRVAGEYSKSDKATSALVSKAANASRQRRGLEARIARVLGGKESASPEDFSNWERIASEAKASAERSNLIVNQRKAVVFERMLSHRLGLPGAPQLSKERVRKGIELNAELDQVNDALAKLGNGDNSAVGAVEREALETRKKEILEQQIHYYVDAMGEGLSGATQNVKNLARTKFENWLSATKEQRGLLKKTNGKIRLSNLPEKLKPMFGAREGAKSVAPKITVDGQDILKDTKGKVALRKFVTDEDRAKADAGKLDTHHELTKDGKPVFQPTGVYNSPEYHAFDRMFKEQHGKSVYDAMQDLQIAEGRYLNFDGKVLTRDRFINHMWENPSLVKKMHVPVKVGGKDIVNKAGLSDEIAGKHVGKEPDKAFDKAGKALVKKDSGTSGQVIGKETYVTTAAKVLRERGDNWMEGFSEAELNQAFGYAFDRELKKIQDSLTKEITPQERNLKMEEFMQEAREQLVKQAEDTADDIPKRDLELRDYSPEEVLEAGKAQAKLEFEQAAEAARQATINAPDAIGTKRWELANKISQLRKAYDDEVRQFDESYDEAVRTREEVKKRLDEEITLRAIDDTDRFGRTSLRIGTIGLNRGVDIPLSEQMIKNVEAFSRAPVIGRAWEAWGKAFSPASKLEPEMNLARKRVQSVTPEIIGHHMVDFKAKYGNIPLAARKAALGAIRAGDLNTEASRAIAEGFDEMVKYLDGSIKFDDVAMTPYEVGKFLPAPYHFISPTGKKLPPITSGQDILRLMRNMPKDEDATKVLWALRIAVEQSMAKQAMNKTLRDTFGIRRELPSVSRMGELSNKGKLIEQMREVHGWKTVDGIGDSHYFPADVAEDIKTLQNIIKPQNVHELVQLHDKVLRTWKATVTVYNPGYYVRNGIGETMMGLFDGLTDIRYYAKARSVLKARPEMADPTREVLKQLTPWKKYESLNASKGRPVVKLPNGKTLTAEEVDILYHDVGLKTGFIATDYQNMMPTEAGLGNNAVTKTAGKTNDFIRRKGEGFEDYFRLAHFMYRLENPVQGRSAARGRRTIEIAQLASEPVRKYHFDYTDFTSFEKTAMMRAFPFYKWTRKAFPLMGSMLMTKPGLVTLYPKFMNNMGYATGAVDPTMDENGILPNYEGLVPKWMQDLFAYPVGEGDEEGFANFVNVATPSLDVYKMANDPVGTLFGMMNPLVKAPLEQLRGETLDPAFQIDLKEDGNRQNHLMDQTPITNLLDKILEGGDDSAITEPGAPIDETLLSYLSGLGVYENNEKRQKGEQMRRNFAGEG